MNGFLANIRWQDVIDIGLNSYVLFRFYILFRGTNVLRVLFGLALIWFAQRLATSMGLIVSSWISQGVTAAAALIVVVVFRNEIRAVLQTKNIRGILWELPKKQTTTPIENIADSAFEMARRHIGALIIIPGKDDLGDIVQHGMQWQGVVSKEMLLSIFWPDNPVHDGAAIVRGRRIEEVGCILPLSMRDDLPSNYGTRHRAALGLAEISDALILLVSEERGTVTIAQNGRLKGIQNQATLEKRLRDHTSLRIGRRSNMLDDRIEIVLASVLSIAFTLGIWFSITRGFDTLATYDVPVEYRNRDSAQEIVETSDNTIKLQLSGSRSLLRSISPDQLRVRLDLNRASIGPNSFSITRDDISLPPGVILKDVQPSFIEVTLDVTTERVLPVQVDWVGTPSDKLILTQARPDPAAVKVIGASQYLDSQTTIYTEKISVEGIKRSGSVEVGLAINPAKLRLASGEKRSVTVFYTVKERTPPE